MSTYKVTPFGAVYEISNGAARLVTEEPALVEAFRQLTEREAS